MNWEVKGSPAFKIKVVFFFPGIQNPVVSEAAEKQGAEKGLPPPQGKVLLNHKQ